jgi:hypothetical protein
MHGHDILRIDNEAALSTKIRQFQTPLQVGPGDRVRETLFGDLGLKFAALGLAFVLWSISFFLVGNSIRTVTVPVEFSNVPADTEISRLSTDTVQVQVRGSAWLLDSGSLNTLVARFDLTGKKEGPQALNVQQSTLSLPPGLIIESMSPSRISLTLVRTGQP